MKKSGHNSSLQAGVTLVELMVGLAVGMLLLLGVGLLFTQNKQSYNQNEALARLQEEARFALEELGRDISMAGFMAEIVDQNIFFVGNTPANQFALETATGSTVSCGLTGLGRNWFYHFPNGFVEDAIRAADNVDEAGAQALFPCIPNGTFQDGTDVIGIKRTSGVPSGVVNGPINTVAPPGRVYIRENGARGVLYQSPNLPQNPGGATPDRVVVPPYNDWEYTPRIYFVRNHAVAIGDGIPTLCRVRLVNDGTGGSPVSHREECFAQGVEDLQIEFGLDTDDAIEPTSGNVWVSANVYVNAADLQPQDLASVVSVRIYLLMRTVNEDVGYRDDRTYTLGNQAPYTPGDRFHRRIYSTTVMVRNVNNIRLQF